MKRPAIVLIVLVLGSAAANGQQLSVEPFPRIWGAGLDLRYGDLSPQSAHDTDIRTAISAAYASGGFFRYPDGSLFDGDGSAEHAYHSVNATWLVGVEQGVVRNAADSGELIFAFGYLRGRIDRHIKEHPQEQLLFRSDLPDENGILQHSLVGGLYASTVREPTAGRSKDGVYAELAAEWAPRELGNDAFGAADFHRYTATVHLFQPLYRRPNPMIDLYIAAQSIADISFGSYVPIAARASFGGREPRSGLGGTVRGLSNNRFDAAFKAAQNVELRIVLPPLGDDLVLPGIVAYGDFGYYYDLEERSPSVSEHSGIAYSAGFGVSTELFGVATLVFYTHFLVSGTRVNGSSWTPIGIGFGYHF